MVTAYAHNLNAQMVQALEQVVDHYWKKGTGCNLQKDITLTKNQYNNFQKLQYFGLVVNTEKGWIPTQLGSKFMAGELVILNPVATFGKEILSPLHEAWKTVEKKPNTLHIRQIRNYNWKGREEYKEERRQTLFQV
jgi:hypothetical protein